MNSPLAMRVLNPRLEKTSVFQTHPSLSFASERRLYFLAGYFQYPLREVSNE